MKTLEQEVEEFYSVKTNDLICSPAMVRAAFKVGANSQYVKNQIIQAQIDVLNEVKHKINLASYSDEDMRDKQIQELQKKIRKMKKRTDNSDAIIEQLRNDAVSEVSPELKENAKQKLSKASLIWNLFYGDYKFSLNDFKSILNKLEK